MNISVTLFDKFLLIRSFFVHINQGATIIEISPVLLSLYIHARCFYFFVGELCIQEASKNVRTQCETEGCVIWVWKSHSTIEKIYNILLLS